MERELELKDGKAVILGFCFPLHVSKPSSDKHSFSLEDIYRRSRIPETENLEKHEL